MSNQGVANYGGRQPDNVQNIKQFVINSPSIVSWIYKKITNTMFVTPSDQMTNVFIPKDLYVSGTLNSTSDANIKENVTSISNTDCDKLFELKPKQYNFIDDATKKIHYGLIAQEVEETYPLLVGEMDNIDENNELYTIKTVNYMELIPIMLRKMQQMQAEIDELREKLIL
jgi:hypothetical protein